MEDFFGWLFCRNGDGLHLVAFIRTFYGHSVVVRKPCSYCESVYAFVDATVV